MKQLKNLVLIAVVAFTVVGVLPLSSVSAQSSASLSIAPKKSYVIEPGKSIEDKLAIRNIDANETLKLNLRVIDFTYTDDSGTPKLNLNQDTEPTPWSLRSYMEVPEIVTVKPGNSSTFDISVAIPENLGAGSYYSAIIYSTTAPDGGNVGLSASGVTLVFVTVPGTVNESLTLKKFGAYNGNVSGLNGYRHFMMDEPRVIAYTLENKGNVTEAPVGTIKLKDMFGHEYTINDVNPSKSLALIGQTRTFQACIKLNSQDVNFQGSKAEASTCTSPGLWPGYYSASIDIFYGQNGNNTQEITKSTFFWYLPLWFLIVAGIVLLFVAYFIWRIVVMIRGGTFALGGGSRRAKRAPARRR